MKTKLFLPRSFYTSRETLELGKSLLGKVLVRITSTEILSGVILETEAYTEEDESCHAFRGKKTKRNASMFLEAGHLYVYFTYGMHYCVNISAEKEGRGCGVLLRSLMPLEGVIQMKQNRKQDNIKNLCNGPAKLSQALEISLKENGLDLSKPKGKIYLRDDGINVSNIEVTKRIGISKAKDKMWRFVATLS